MYAELLLQRYADATPQLLAQQPNPQQGEDFALSTSHDYLLFINEIAPEGGDVTALQERAIAWILAQKEGALGEAVKNCFSKGGRVMIQSFTPEIQGNTPAKLNRNGASADLAWEHLFPEADETVQALHAKIQDLKANLPEDLRSGFQSVKAISEEIKQSFILRNQKSDLFTALNEVHALLTAKQDALKGEMDSVYVERFNEFQPKVAEICGQVDTVEDQKEYRETLKNLQYEVRDLDIDRERKEVLFASIRETFDKLNVRSAAEREAFTTIAAQNHELFEPKLADAIDLVKRTEAFADTREYLKSLQLEIREAKLTRESRDTFRGMFDEIFTTLNDRQDEERTSFLATCDYNFGALNTRLNNTVDAIETTSNYNDIREDLKEIQADMRENKLTREQRDQLWAALQSGFETLNQKQNGEREEFLTVANANYEVLKTKIEKGLQLAQESTDFKGIREYLKTTQSEFWELKLTREQREELKPVVNDSFTILNKRADAFYTERQRTWLERLSEKKIRLEQVKVSIEQQLDKDVFFLDQQKEKIENSWEYKDSETVRNAYDAKIKQVETQIEEKKVRLADIDKELTEIAEKLAETTAA